MTKQEVIIEQDGTIVPQGKQYHVIIQKKYHEKLKQNDLLNRKLSVTISFKPIES